MSERIEISPEDTTATILLVDDDKDLREFLYQSLMFSGYSVLQANSGFQALERFAQNAEDIDLVISDILMPGLLGDQLAVRLLQQKPELKLLFISGHAVHSYGTEIPLVEGKNFLRKPFELGELESAIQRLLRGENV